MEDFIRHGDEVIEYETYFNSIMVENQSVHSLEIEKEELKTLWEVFRLEYNDLMSRASNPKSNEETAKTSKSAASFDVVAIKSKYRNVYKRYVDILSTINSRIEDQLTNNTVPATPSGVLDSTIDPTSHIKLPACDPGIFYGDYLSWPTFRDLFTAFVINNPAIKSPVVKLYHLINHTRDEAREVIRGAPLRNEGFPIAWKNLVDRYENKRILINNQLKTLLNLSPIERESGSSIQLLQRTINDCLSTLKSLDIDIKDWDPIIVYLCSTHLPVETLGLWEQSLDCKSDLPLWKDLDGFLTNRYQTLESISDIRGSSSTSKVQRKKSSPNEHNPVRSYHTNTNPIVCLICKDDHKIRSCPVFGQMSVDDRYLATQEHRLCTNCLSTAHFKGSCRSKFLCSHCKLKHHSLLCRSPTSSSRNGMSETPSSAPYPNVAHNQHTPIQPTPQTPYVNQTQTFSTQASTTELNKTVVLGTARVYVRVGDIVYPARALIDPASEATFVSERLQQTLKIKTNYTHTQVWGLNDTISAMSTKSCSLTIQSSLDPLVELVSQAFIIKKLTGMLPSSAVSSFVQTQWKDLKLADAEFHHNTRVDLLLGGKLYGKILKGETRISPDGSLVAQETIFGYIITGTVESPRPHNSVNAYFNSTQIDYQITKFWELEEPPKASMLSQADQYCEETYKKSTIRTPEGRYMVSLPFKPSVGKTLSVSHSRKIAYLQFTRNESRLLKDPTSKVCYDSVIDEYLTLGHMVPIQAPGGEDPSLSYYLPHHAVIKPHSTTTKVRVVFNASCPSANRTSLNDLLYPGPVLQSDLTILILRWRLHKFVFNADIEKMYRQILVNPEHTPYQRMLFRKSNQNEVQDFELKTVTFGVNCAPYLAIRTLLQLADDNETQYPTASYILKNCMYVDDVLYGTHSFEGALSARKELVEVLKSAGFSLKKWTSNNQQILNDVPPADLLDSKFLNLSENSTTKTLGLRWNAGTDCFHFDPLIISTQTNFTKRKVLSEIAKLFDPAGWLAPKIVVAKILMQQIWLDKTDWDDSLNPVTLQKWKIFVEDYCTLNMVKIPRWVEFSPQNKIELHGFCDSSEKAYAASLYIRSITPQGNIYVHLLAAKTKVAPIAQKSIPKLELCGAELLARLAAAIRKELDLSMHPLYLWTDSTIVLAWLKKPPFNWQTFVANRIAAIAEKVGVDNWYHVESKENPSDLASRGTTLADLIQQNLWWKGPDWLSAPNFDGRSQLSTETLETSLESKGVKVHLVSLPKDNDILEAFSSLTRALRVVTWIFRFFRRTHPKFRTKFYSNELTVLELQTTKTRLIWLAQKQFFPLEIQSLLNKEPLPRKSPLIPFNPFIDSNGLVRVNGRLAKSPVLSYNERYPILLPYSSRYTHLLVEFTHTISIHGENSLMLRLLRMAFWIPKAKNIIKKVIRSCKVCVILKQKRMQQIMAALPPERTHLTRPFTHTGVDFAGPFDIKSLIGRGCRISKGYVLVFVCFSTKAIHLEATSDMSTPVFLAAFSRFFSRRGSPAIMYSDNGTSFVGAAKQLERDFLKTLQNSIAASNISTSVEWKFIPPGAPHMGGLWEAGVKSFKAHLKKIAPNCRFTFEEFSTLLARIEACLNSRPISPMSDNPDDVCALTPGHFLTGSPLLAPAEPDLLDQSPNYINRWQKVKRLHQHLAQRWKDEYLKELHKRYKWQYQERDISVGDIVVVRHENVPPTQWRLGRIQKIYSGHDSKVRVADILTQKGVITRPIVKLVILPTNSD